MPPTGSPMGMANDLVAVVKQITNNLNQQGAALAKLTQGTDAHRASQQKLIDEHSAFARILARNSLIDPNIALERATRTTTSGFQRLNTATDSLARTMNLFKQIGPGGGFGGGSGNASRVAYAQRSRLTGPGTAFPNQPVTYATNSRVAGPGAVTNFYHRSKGVSKSTTDSVDNGVKYATVQIRGLAREIQAANVVFRQNAMALGLTTLALQSFGAAASPDAMKTLTSSFALAEAAVGQELVPWIVEAAFELQHFAVWFHDLSPETKRMAVAAGLATVALLGLAAAAPLVRNAWAAAAIAGGAGAGLVRGAIAVGGMGVGAAGQAAAGKIVGGAAAAKLALGGVTAAGATMTGIGAVGLGFAGSAYGVNRRANRLNAEFEDEANAQGRAARFRDQQEDVLASRKMTDPKQRLEFLSAAVSRYRADEELGIRAKQFFDLEAVKGNPLRAHANVMESEHNLNVSKYAEKNRLAIGQELEDLQRAQLGLGKAGVPKSRSEQQGLLDLMQRGTPSYGSLEDARDKIQVSALDSPLQQMISKYWDESLKKLNDIAESNERIADKPAGGARR